MTGCKVYLLEFVCNYHTWDLHNGFLSEERRASLINNYEGAGKKPFSPPRPFAPGTKANRETDQIIQVTCTSGSDQLMIRLCGLGGTQL